MRVCASLVIVMSLVNLAFADESGKAEARKHFQRGARLIRTGAYPQAATEFELAYRLYPNERLHYDIAQAERLAGHRDQAVEHYRRYLASVTNGELADDARAQLAALGAPPVDASKLDPPPAKEAAPASESTPGTLSASALPSETRAPPVVPVEPVEVEPIKPLGHEPATSAPPLATTPPPIALPPSTTHRPLYQTWWVWTAAGAAVAVGLGVGLAVGLEPHPPSPTMGKVTF